MFTTTYCISAHYSHNTEFQRYLSSCLTEKIEFVPLKPGIWFVLWKVNKVPVILTKKGHFDCLLLTIEQNISQCSVLYPS